MSETHSATTKRLPVYAALYLLFVAVVTAILTQTLDGGSTGTVVLWVWAAAVLVSVVVAAVVIRSRVAKA